jgi:uncharacterized protein
MITIPSIALAGNTDNIRDDLNYLSDQELQEIQTQIDEVVSTYGLDIAIVITDNTDGKSSMDFADDYFDYNGFGTGSDRSGLLLLINMDIREAWISTSGKAIDIFTDSRINDVLDAIYPYLSSGDYTSACTEFVSQTGRFAQMGVPDGQYRQDVTSYTYWERAVRLMKSPVVYIIAIGIAAVGVLIASSGNKGKVTVGNRTYEESGSFHLVDKRDDFINQTITKVRITTNSGSGGSSSSVHRSSSGRSHGGGGRRF